MNPLDLLCDVFGFEHVAAAILQELDRIQYDQALFAYYADAYSGRVGSIL